MNLPYWAIALTLAAVLTNAPIRAQQQHDMPVRGQNQTADQDMMAGMGKMNRDMGAVPMTGDADRDFVAMMIPHHQGAIEMAQAELRYGKDRALHRMATEIVAAQKNEIAVMRRWQAAHPVH
jgi:uncharacterized protein (DUF305 family)